MAAAGRRGLSTKAASTAAAAGAGVDPPSSPPPRKRRNPQVAKKTRKIVNGGGGAEMMKVLSLVPDRPVSASAAQPFQQPFQQQPFQQQPIQSAQAAAAEQRAAAAAEAAREMRSALQGFARENMLKKLRRTRQEERVAKGKSKYWGVYSVKRRTGRWEAQSTIGGKSTSLGQFGSEEEAARAWDRMRLWSCKGRGKKKEEVQLNFPLSDYSDAEVAALQRSTQEKMLQKLRRTGQEERVANQWSGYTGVTLDTRTGRWNAQYTIGGKTAFLGYFDSEEEAACAWDRMRLWSCKAEGKRKEQVQLNVPLSEYTDDEVAALQGLTQEEIIEKLWRTEERVANQTSGYTGVTLYTRTGRWKAQCAIGGNQTSLGYFGSEEEAAHAWDRMRLWSCKADGKRKEEVQLNFPLSEYTDDEGCTQEEMIQKLRRTAKQPRSEYSADGVTA
jgi:hypothetical protein